MNTKVADYGMVHVLLILSVIAASCEKQVKVETRRVSKNTLYTVFWVDLFSKQQSLKS